MSPRLHPVVLFDGMCTLCDGAVQWIIDRDPNALFQFASLQSVAGQTLAITHGIDPARFDTLVLIADGRARVRSDAVLEVARRLGSPWSWASFLSVLPLHFRDALYRTVARNRLRWFGQRIECRIPTPDLKARFLDALP